MNDLSIGENDSELVTSLNELRLISVSREEIQKLYDFVRRFPLDYPDYFVWLEKCRRELELGYKKAFCSISSGGEVVGSIIFQPHKQESSVLEIKSARVDPSCKQYGIGTALIDLVEKYAKEKGFRRIRGDAHPGNPVIEFLRRRGYKIEAQESLYTPSLEIVLCKEV